MHETQTANETLVCFLDMFGLDVLDSFFVLDATLISEMAFLALGF